MQHIGADHLLQPAKLAHHSGINIATFHLGRKEAGGEAIALVEIDGQIDAAVMVELRGLKQVVRADMLHFD